MADPKMALTKFSDVYGAKFSPPGASGYFMLATTMAAVDAVRERDQAAFGALQAEHSISSVQELVALALLDSRTGAGLVKRTGVAEATVKRLVTSFRKTPEGKEEIEDWSRYDRLEYATGAHLDLENPPPDALPLASLVVGAGAVLGAAAGGPGVVAAPAASSANLIGTHMSQIRDQAGRGTCTAFAGLACLEYFQHRFGGHPSVNLSEQFAYWNMVTATGDHNLVSMFSRLQADGSCTERTWPYYGREIDKNDAQGPPPPQAKAKALAYRPANVRQLPPREVAVIKAALARDQVVAIGIPVYASWMESPVVRKYGNITVPFPGEIPDPIGHAIALVGYADNIEYAGGGYFIVRNSWGSNWGTEGVFGPGYGTIPYLYIERLNWDAWCVQS